MIGPGPLPSASSAESIAIFQISPVISSRLATTTDQRAHFTSEIRPRRDGAHDLSRVPVEPAVGKTSVMLNPAADNSGDQSARVASVDLSLGQNLHRVLLKRSRDGEMDAAQQRRKRKSSWSKRASAVSAIFTVVVVLAAYAVITSERLYGSPDVANSVHTGPAVPTGPPVQPWPSLHWEKRSNAPACRNKGWMKRNVKACVQDEQDSLVSCSHSAHEFAFSIG